MIMSKEIDNIFVDVRNAFRLLNRYQKRVLSIVDYIREQTPYTEMWGGKADFFDCINTKRNSPDGEYANLNVHRYRWGWDFLYGYIFEYYFGKTKLEPENKNAEMSVFQISDDGFFVSPIPIEKKSMTDIASFASAESSHTFLVLNIAVFATEHSQLWLHDPEQPNDNYKDFLTKFLSSSNDCTIKEKDGEIIILKKYEMQRFATQQSADSVIRDFARIVKERTGICLFKEEFYD